VHPLGGGVTRQAGRALLLARALAALAAEHRRGAFDLLHAFWADEPGALAVTAGALLGVPALVSLAGGELAGFPEIGYGGRLHRTSRRLTRIALHRAAAVTAGSAYLRELAAPLAGRVELLPLGVDTGLFGAEEGKRGGQARGPAPTGNVCEWAPRSPGRGGPPWPPSHGRDATDEDEAIHVLQVASLVAVKQPGLLLAAFARALEACPALRLHLVGEGPLEGTLRAQAEQLGIAGQICWHGAVPHEQLPAYYRAADFCVLASRHEAQGMVVLEAAAAGRVTVGTRVGIVPELAPDYSVAVDDVAGLAAAMAALAGDAGLRAVLGRRAHDKVNQRYTLRQTAGQTLALYRELAAGARRGR
ncbi:MAG TPA: glycosyltransferase, partial [Thermomicrobiaceae bacterium]|nr:glycosyltransferase [Thermomicrobiaceae bacterium]